MIEGSLEKDWIVDRVLFVYVILVGSLEDFIIFMLVVGKVGSRGISINFIEVK